MEHIFASIIPTDPAYLRNMDRRISALVILWWDSVEPLYAEPHLRNFVMKTRDSLFEHCRAAGYRAPSPSDLAEMADSGAYPGECEDFHDGAGI
ncbi:conserved hypothetical protein [Methylocella tundrae]|nr:conserved hypothetical protein [Methylocella tundrae]